MMAERYGWKWWGGGVAKEGIAHVLLSLAIAAVLWPVYGLSAAALGNLVWFASREFLDVEVELAGIPPELRPLVTLLWTGLVGVIVFNIEPPAIAGTMLACSLLSRIVRNAEIVSLPRLWRWIGCKSDAPLRPAVNWSLEQLRHGISGVLPVWIVWLPVYVIVQ